MAIYTVHEPPLRAAESAADPQRFVFVRDGFHVWAFLLTVFWMLRHRLWLALLAYLALVIGIEVALLLAGVDAGGRILVFVLIKLLVGLEAGTLRRLTLTRRGWKNIGVIGGHGLEDAERRFFAEWTKRQAAQPASPASAAPPPPGAPLPPPLTRAPQLPPVIGLFPEPGAQR